jgi:hypothetical protein
VFSDAKHEVDEDRHIQVVPDEVFCAVLSGHSQICAILVKHEQE